MAELGDSTRLRVDIIGGLVYDELGRERRMDIAATG